MRDTNKPKFYTTIYHLKMAVFGLVLAVVGILVSIWADSLEDSHAVNELVVKVVRGVSDFALLAGAFSVATTLVLERSKAKARKEENTEALREIVPEITDSVLHAFDASPESLKRIATPELLDSIAANALGLRLDDNEFAHEVYADLVHNVISAPERWRDVDVRIRLSSIDERSTVGAPRFAVTVTWEYTVIPSSPVKRFACTSDRDEFHELVSDVPSTSTWFMTARPGFDASAKDAFELLQFSVDGEKRDIHRHANTKRTSQTYSATIGKDIVEAGKPVRIRHVYRTITPQSGHRLFIALAQPAHGLSLSIDYTDTNIAHMSVTDLVSSAQRPRLARLPNTTEAREITMDVPGWLLPQSGVTLVWTLTDEVPAERDTRSAASRSAA